MLLATAASAPAEEPAWSSLLEEGRSLCIRGEYSDATRTLKDACALAKAAGAQATTVAEIEHLLGLAVAGTGDYAGAESHARAAVALIAQQTGEGGDERLPAFRMDLAAILMKGRQLDAAEATLCDVLCSATRTPTVEVDCLFRIAAVAVRRHAYGLALETMRRALGKMEVLDLRERAAPFVDACANLGWLAMELGQYDEATTFLQSAARTLGGSRSQASLKVAATQVELLRRQGAHDRASMLAREALESYLPAAGVESTEIAALMISLAQIKLDARDLSGAESELARVRVGPTTDTAEAKWVRLVMARAQLALLRGDAKSSRDAIALVVERRGRRAGGGLDLARAWLLLASVEQLDGRPAVAAECADRAARIYLRELGGQHGETRDCCRRLAMLRSDALAAGTEPGRLPPALLGMRRSDAIEAGWEKTDAAVAAMLRDSRDSLAAGAAEKALSACDDAARLRPGDAGMCHQRAVVLDKLGRTAEAVQALGIGIECNSTEASLYALRAALCAKLGNYERVVVDTTHALLVGGDEAQCCFLRGCAQFARENFDSALTDLARWKRSEPTNPRAILWEAKALLEVKLSAQAESALRSLIDTGRGGSEARVVLADLCRRRGDLELALRECVRAAEGDPGNMEAIWLRALIHTDLARWQEALRDLARYEECAEGVSPRLWMCRWLCLRHQDDKAGADTALRRAIECAGTGSSLGRVATGILSSDRDVVGAAVVEEPVKGARCEALYFGAAWLDLEGDVAGALALLDQAMALHCPNVDLFHSATTMQARLKSAKR
jgi:tetratricopeptide (TPR) repeat protein